MVAALVHWFYGDLARRLLKRLLQQGLSGFGEEGTIPMVRLQLAPVLVAVGRWSMTLVVIFITSDLLCATMNKHE